MKNKYDTILEIERFQPYSAPFISETIEKIH